MSLPAGARTGPEVMAQFIPACPLGAKLGIVAEVLDGNEVLSEINAAAGMLRHGQIFGPAEREAIVSCGTATRHRG